jgi:hypothetical protein
VIEVVGVLIVAEQHGVDPSELRADRDLAIVA